MRLDKTETFTTGLKVHLVKRIMFCSVLTSASLINETERYFCSITVIVFM